jgi:hypothetical protein
MVGAAIGDHRHQPASTARPISHLQRESNGLNAPYSSRQPRAERMRKAAHRLVVLEHIAAQATHACKSRVLRQDSRQRGSETDPAPLLGATSGAAVAPIDV